MPFDIASLRAFAPPRYQCEKCLALLREWLFQLDLPADQTIACPICRVVYLPTKDFGGLFWDRYIEWRRLTCLDRDEALAQAQQLGEIAERMRSYQQNQDHASRNILGDPPLYGLLKALSIARKFVHFRPMAASLISSSAP